MSDPKAAASPEPVAWGCFYPGGIPGGMLNVDLVGTEADCQCWATSEDRQAQWIVRPLYDNTERLALLEGLLAKAMERMTRARSILTDDRPRPECNWGMLDVSDIRAALGE
jgi:hypothetical protein